MSEPRPAPPFLTAASWAARLVFPRLLWGPRARLVAVLLAWPLVLPLLGWAAGSGMPGRAVVFELYLGVMLPLAALVHATRLVRDDVESRTIVYLLSRPVSRPALFAGELAAYHAAALAVALPASVAGWFLTADPRVGAASFPGLLAAVVFDVAAFGTFFALLGMLLKRPLVVGVLFLLWEWLLLLWSLFSERFWGGPALLARVTVTGYVRALVAADPAGVTAGQAAVVLGVLVLVCATAGAAVFAAREWVPEP
jgi:ABC-2 type transport system permease protein